jgi:hypothetical protein
MAKKRKTYSSMEFHEMIEVGSASSWTKFNLGLFHVDYERYDYDSLPIEAREYDNVDETSPFGKRESFGEYSNK